MGEKRADDMRRGLTNGPLIPLPVPIGDQQRRKQPPEPSWWFVCSNWLRYHGIQLRWDIERFLARRFHRHWGG
jgi:hypothetical protein